MPRVALETVTDYLDRYLRIREVPDESGAVNGLQVANRGWVGGIVAAVDASQATIDGVVAAAARFEAPPLILVHLGCSGTATSPSRVVGIAAWSRS